MEPKRIDNPRPFYEEITPKASARYERIEAGGATGGIILDITRKGLIVNGYYQGFRSDTKFANTLRPIMITWEDLEKAKKRIDQPAKRIRKRAGITPDRVEETVDQEYLDSLPKVNINGSPYYIDGERRERRPVNNPEKVYKF